jgi:dephospho-CoA kinase
MYPYHVLGITGPLGCGKSTIVAWLETQGWQSINADRVAHTFYEPDSPVAPQLIALFGTLDRARIREQVFHDAAQLEALNALLHPLINERIRTILEEAFPGEPTLWVIEAALLFEIGLDALCDTIWAVCSEEPMVVKRLASKGWDKPLVHAVLQTQKTKPFLLKHAHRVFDNNGSKELLLAQAKAALRGI